MLKNLAKLDQTEMDKVNVDLAAAGVAFKERFAQLVSRAAYRPPFGFGQSVTFTLRAQT